jgi:RNA polymerase sigma-70 factor (ECF subfamily)
MKAWLAQAVEATARRGEDRHNRIARWSRWFPATPTVDAASFQGSTDPYPRHWRAFPRPWRRRPTDDAAVAAELRRALADLPPRWRAVVERRDVDGVDAATVARELGLTGAQQRAMLNRGRAELRRRLTMLPSMEPEP